jgi:hypothetical protein
MPVMLGGGALCYWAAEGFEVVLVGVLSLAGFRIASARPLTRRGAAAFGILFGVAVLTRMDAVIYWVGSILLVVYKARRQRVLGWLALSAALAGTLIAGHLIWRYAYYGEWLPNTYFLKATNWALSDRLEMGLGRDKTLFPAAVLACGLLAIPGLRRALSGRCLVVGACFATFALSVVYSVQNGGDTWRLIAGHDRYTVIGSLFLMLGLAIIVTSAQLGRAWLVITAIACALLATDPATRPATAVEFHFNHLISERPPVRALEREWLDYGERFKELSKPGARIAICPAGAIVYASHRGGVDLLGKIDPYVARLRAAKTRPPNAFCWQNNPGHNKGDDLAVLRKHKPDFTRYRLPRDLKKDYQKMQYRGHTFYVRKGTPYLDER